jgi:hypothetical protein
MADEPVPGTDPGGQPTDPNGAPPPPEPDPPKEDDGLKKALNSERQLRAAAEKKLKAFEDAQKSELEKATERADAAEKRAAELERSVLRARVAAKHDLPAELADRLQGDDEAALEEDAKRLSALVSPPADMGGRRGGSVGGSGSSTGSSADDINAAIRRMAGRTS